METTAAAIHMLARYLLLTDGKRVSGSAMRRRGRLAPCGRGHGPMGGGWVGWRVPLGCGARCGACRVAAQGWGSAHRQAVCLLCPPRMPSIPRYEARARGSAAVASDDLAICFQQLLPGGETRHVTHRKKKRFSSAVGNARQRWIDIQYSTVLVYRVRV